MMPLPRAGRRCRGIDLTGGAGSKARRFVVTLKGWPLGGRSTLKEGESSREEIRVGFWLARNAGRVNTLESSACRRGHEGSSETDTAASVVSERL
jgi:hypothetical protein